MGNIGVDEWVSLASDLKISKESLKQMEKWWKEDRTEADIEFDGD